MAKKRLEEIYLDYDAQVWCFHQGYRIYPRICKGGYQIHIELGEKKATINEVYSEKDIYTEIWKIYTKLYIKNKNE